MKKSFATTEAELEAPFQLESITQTDAPAGEQGVWHSYVISQGTNKITGMRAGTRTEVSALVEDMVQRLNERRRGKPRAVGR